MDVVRRVLSFDLGQKVVEMSEQEGATLDGGDVLFTGMIYQTPATITQHLIQAIVYQVMEWQV